MKTILVTHGNGSTQTIDVADDWEGDPSEFSITLESFNFGLLVNAYNGHAQYLKDTDWYVARKAETGKDIPQDVLDARAVARDFISANRDSVDFGLMPPSKG